MHFYGWKTELGRLLLVLAVAAAIGALLDVTLWLVLVAAVGYALWSLFQLQQLNDWLAGDRGQEPPVAAALWGQVFDMIYQIQREDREVRRRLQSMVDHLRASFASLSDATVMLDPDGNIEWSNRAATTLLGLRQPEDSGRQLINLVRTPAFIRYFEAEDYTEPLQMVSPTNRAIHLSINITFFGQRSRLLFARDVSRTHRLEQMRKDFIANVSHELRTPLTVISGYLETFAGQPDLDPRWARAIAQMREQSRRMQGLIQDLMTLSRLESVPRPKEQELIRLRPLMDMLREEALVAAEGERQVEVECDEKLLLRGCSSELRSAFSNLVINAARYTRPGDAITLRWFSDREAAYFQVEDTGIGIAPQHIPRITERFYRVDPSRSSATGGTGLGLAIVKHVLIRHQAELRVSSTPEKGSIFTCVFPLSLTERAAA